MLRDGLPLSKCQYLKLRESERLMVREQRFEWIEHSTVNRHHHHYHYHLSHYISHRQWQQGRQLAQLGPFPHTSTLR